jgi:hypothetical protein
MKTSSAPLGTLEVLVDNFVFTRLYSGKYDFIVLSDSVRGLNEVFVAVYTLFDGDGFRRTGEDPGCNPTHLAWVLNALAPEWTYVFDKSTKVLRVRAREANSRVPS